jgi:hypothetical protein
MATIPDNNLVRVVCNSNEEWLPLIGRTIGSVKKSLREVFNISYFSDPLVNGHIADISDTLSAGDSLEFVMPFGFKGGEGQQPHEYQIAKALITADPELQEIRKQVKCAELPTDKSIDQTILLVTDHFIHKYGHPSEREQPVFLEVARQLMVMSAALADLYKTGQSIQSVQLVHFDPLTHIFFVHGKEKRGLSEPQMNVLQALWEAGGQGLSKDQLESDHSDARGILRRLMNADPDWAAVIHFPGKPHGSYRLG